MGTLRTILTGQKAIINDLGLLLMRLVFGGFMLFAHGYGKLTSYGERAAGWADPIGIGSELSLALAIGAEVFCALLVMIGLGTRFMLVPLIITMIVAGFIHHGNDPFGDKEMALMYLAGYTAMLMWGPGRFSLDHLIAKRLGRKR